MGDELDTGSIQRCGQGTALNCVQPHKRMTLNTPCPACTKFADVVKKHYTRLEESYRRHDRKPLRKAHRIADLYDVHYTLHGSSSGNAGFRTLVYPRRLFDAFECIQATE
eukprot:scpid72351/ scgid24702/ 